MGENSITDGWPGTPAVMVLRLDGGSVVEVARAGDVTTRREWASVSKMAVSLAFGVEADWGLHEFQEGLGPHGASLANLLSHSSGLGLEVGDPVVPVATKRVYSNYAVDYAVRAVVHENDPAAWLDGRIFQPLGMHDTALEGRPAAGVVGSTEDLATLAVAWLRSDGLALSTRQRIITPYLASLDGIVPGFGRFSPCPWGLGPEVRGEKSHWMGDWSPTSFGHFGQSGALLLVNVEERIGLVATSTVPFGIWAAQLWPDWTSAMRRLALSS